MGAFCLGLAPFVAQAAKTAPDVLGTWVGMSNSAIIGAGQHHPDGSDGEIRFRRVEFTLKIDRQEGRNFSGLFSTASHKEPVVGAFAADVANLSRIVTLNNITIVPGRDGALTMDATARTFRYLDQDEIAAQRAAARGAKK